MLILVAENDSYSPAEFCEKFVEGASGPGSPDIRIKKYAGTRHGWLNDSAASDCEDCMTFRDCGLMYIDDNGHESALDGRVSTLFGWQEYIENLYRQCGNIGVILRTDPATRNDTLVTTVFFFSEKLLAAP